MGPILRPEANYLIRDQIAAGGAGVVLRAHDIRLGREVALKELKRDHPTLRARFHREIRITARLEHPNIVPVHDAGTWKEDVPFFVMKLVEGEHLAEALDTCETYAQRIELLPHIIDVADAIAYAHSEGIIHRDLKPLNVLVGPFGETVVIDWGLAKELDRPSVRETTSPGPKTETPTDSDPADGSDETDGELGDDVPFATHTGTVIGTPAYMPPEQALGIEVDARADVYALGAVLYHVLAGVAPYHGTPREARLDVVIAGPPRPLRELAPDAPRDLLAVVDKAMARDRQHRYADASEMAQELKRYQAGRPVDAHDYGPFELIGRLVRRHRAALAVALVALFALVTLAVWAFVNIAQQRNIAEASAEAEAKARAVAESSAAAEAQARKEAERAAVTAAAAREQAERRADELTVERARSLLERHPTQALAWLKTLTRPVDGMPSVAAAAIERGVARRILRGHEDAVTRVVTSPDGELIASSGADGTVRIHDIAAKKTRVLEGHSDRVPTLVFSPDGATLASGGYGGEVRVWDASTGATRVLGRHEGAAYVVRFAPDGETVASLGADDTLRLWDVESGDARVYSVPVGRHRLLEFSPDGTWLVSGSHGKALRVQHLGTDLARWLVGHRAPVTSMAFSPDGLTLASGARDGTVWFWNLALGSGGELARVPENGVREGGVEVAFSPDGEWFAWASAGGQIELRSMRTGESQLAARHGDRVSTLAFSADSSAIVSGGWDNTVRVWDVARGAERVLRGHDDVVSDAVFLPSPDRESRHVVSGAWDKTVRIWSLRLDDRRMLRGHEFGVHSVAFSPDGKRVASGGHDDTVREWDIDTGETRVMRGHRDHVYSVVYSPDGETIASTSDDRTVRLWTRSGDVTVLRGHTGDVEGVEFSPDGRWLVSTARDGTARLWSVETGEARVLEGHENDVTEARFTPDGAQLVTGSRDHTVRLWDVATGREAELLGRHEGEVWSVDVAPDGRYVASVGRDALRLWPLADKNAQRVPRRFAGARRVRFSPDGEQIAVGGGQNGIWVCSVRGINCRHMTVDSGVVHDLAFSPDGTLVATARADNTVRLWDVTRGESVPLHGHEATVFDVAFSPDGQRLVSGGGDALVAVWSVRRPPPLDGILDWLDAQTEVSVDEL